MFAQLRPRISKICMKTLFYVSACTLFLIVLLSRNYMFSSCSMRESTLKVLGKNSFYDLETSAFKNGGFMKGNIVIDEKITAMAQPLPRGSSLEHALQTKAKDGIVVLSIVDSRYAKLALNLYKTSLEKFNLMNYLMVCIDEESFKSLTKYGLHCVLHQTNQTEKTGDFGSSGYVQKTNLKTRIVLDALYAGYTLLVVDLDVVMFQNPFPYFDCKECELHVTRDRVQFNTGFIFVRPTANTKYLYKVAWDLYQKYHKGSDQVYFNSAVTVLKNEGIKLKMKELPTKTFLCGVFYFQDGRREFAGKPCVDCVMVHNNYIGSLAAKIYRFKENLFWLDDTDQYYSSSNAKYLTYDNPYFFGDKTWELEIQALKSALIIAKNLNRILILPKFHCCQCVQKRCEGERHRCSLLSLLNVKSFDVEFSGQYRENVFLQNPMVPKKYNEVAPDQQQRHLFLIKTQVYDLREDIVNNSTIQVITPKSASVGEITSNFAPFASENVLRFHSLYGLEFAEEVNTKSSSPVTTFVPDEAFACVDYEQWEVPNQ